MTRIVMYFFEKFVLRIVDSLLYVSNVSSTEIAQSTPFAPPFLFPFPHLPISLRSQLGGLGKRCMIVYSG